MGENKTETERLLEKYDKKLVDFIDMFIGEWQNTKCPNCRKRWTDCVRVKARRFSCSLEFFMEMVDVLLVHFAYPDWEEWEEQNKVKLNEGKARKKLFEDKLMKTIRFVVEHEDYKWVKKKQ